MTAPPGDRVDPDVELDADISRRKRAKSARRSVSHWLVPTVSLTILGTMVLIAVFAPLLTPHEPVGSDLLNSRLPPRWLPGGDPNFILGTDALGRDVLTRIMYGARLSLSVGFLAVLVGGGIGTFLGLVAAYVGGWVENLIMRLADFVLAFPTILLAIVIATAFGASFLNVLIVISVIIWPRFARQARAEALEIMEEAFFQYARHLGVPWYRVVSRHLLLNITPSLIVLATWQLGFVILAESALSFLGVGIPPPQPAWGVMVAEGRNVLTIAWWISFFPGVALLLVVFSVNLFGDWLRDWLDPKRQ